ncbi:MAG: DUF2286 domain-containing protein [Acidilobaceae archaeon]|nr:DUF2286 domain-containing protein [Acidilobaceae archaeon]
MSSIGKVIVVRAEKGRITASSIEEGDLYSLVKKYLMQAAQEWDPSTSDFVALKDNKDVELESVDLAALREVEKYGVRWRRERDYLRVTFPTYTISFDNLMVSEKEYVENKVYLIAPFISEEVKEQLELEAAEITAPPQEPGGLREIG